MAQQSTEREEEAMVTAQEERPDLTISDHKQQKVGIAEQAEDWLHVGILCSRSWLDWSLSSAWRVRGLLLEDWNQTQSTSVCDAAVEGPEHSLHHLRDGRGIGRIKCTKHTVFLKLWSPCMNLSRNREEQLSSNSNSFHWKGVSYQGKHLAFN